MAQINFGFEKVERLSGNIGYLDYDRPSDQTHQFWTLPYVPGKRLIGKDVYLLTSNRTFSAAEDFAYGLKNLKRVTIVGEVTGGGAHPGGPRRINDHFFIGVPAGRSISTVTHTDWEGVGVEPDVRVAADRALLTAHLMALEKRAPVVTDPRIKSEITAAIERLKTEIGATNGPPRQR
jgi:C-terminal processing protease CtpA/Prc